jgi:uncharacterized protein (DUF927 family)
MEPSQMTTEDTLVADGLQEQEGALTPRDRRSELKPRTKGSVSRFADLLPDTGLICVAFGKDKPNRGVKFFANKQEALDFSRAFPDGQCWLAYGSYKKATTREGSNVAALKALIFDADTGKPGTYPTKEDAWAALWAFIEKTGLPEPTYIMDSGHGWHVWFGLTQEVSPERWRQVALRLKALLQKTDPILAQDTTRVADAAGLLRAPGSYNRKSGGEKKVTIVHKGALVDLDVFEAKLPVINLPAVKPNGLLSHLGPVPQHIIERRKKRHATNNGVELEDPDYLHTALLTMKQQAEDYEPWFKTGQALWNAAHEGKLSEDDAFVLFDDFSALASVYRGTDDVESYWNTKFKWADKPPRVGLGSIYEQAKLSGWTPPVAKPAKAKKPAPPVAEEEQGEEYDEEPDESDDSYLPAGYLRMGNKIFLVEEAKPKKPKKGKGETQDETSEDEDKQEPTYKHVCSDLRFSALAHEESGRGHRLIVKVRSLATGEYTEWQMERSVLKGDGSEAREAILERGGAPPTDAHGRYRLNNLLTAANPPTVRPSVSATGWHGRRFVYPDAIYGQDGTTQEPIFTGPTDTAYDCKGALGEWTKKVSKPLSGNARPMHAINVALAGPALKPCGMDSFITHYHSVSTTSKTSSLIVACSVHGGGERKSYTRKWSSTANGIEGMAAAHNDTMLGLDEIGMADAREVGDAAYRIASGAGKARMKQDASMRQQKAWTCTVLSTGEKTLEEHMTDKRGARTKALAGHLVRCNNIPADAGKGMGMLECIPAEYSGPAEFADDIVEAATKRFYGTAGREFVRRFAADYEGSVATIKRYVDEFVKGRQAAIKKHLGEDAGAQVNRVLRQFGIAAAAGRLATDWGITGWSKDGAFWASAQCFAAWLSAHGTLRNYEGKSAVDSLREFIAANESRFQDRHQDPLKRIVPRDRVGFRDTYEISPAVKDRKTGRITKAQVTGPCFIVFDHALSEVCGGIAERTAAEALKVAGLLILPKPRGLKHFPQIDGKRHPAYFIGADKL